MGAVQAAYAGLIADGELRPDPAQREVVRRLDALASLLASPPRRPGLFARLGGAPEPGPIRGVYLWGGVGRGKSMLMDMFFKHVAVEPRHRIHFHEFMLEIHDAIHHQRQAGGDDPIPAVAAKVAHGARLLALDEMQVKDVADAAILSRLFTALFHLGVTVVATSNRAPDDLYKDGLNRQLFLPFIALLKQRCDVVALDGPTDYRLQRLGGVATWYVPNGSRTTKQVSDAFFSLTDYPVANREMVPSENLAIHGGRTLFVPKAVKGVAVFSFARLCRRPLGAADYLTIARHYHTVFVVGIPVMGPENRNEAARFVTLIDAFYEYKVKLIATADAVPEALYPEGDGSFEFQRTVSRLMEMQSAEYMALGHG